MRLPPDGEEANRIASRARTGQAEIESIESQTQRMPPPPLYDLTELRRSGHRQGAAPLIGPGPGAGRRGLGVGARGGADGL